MLHLHLHHHYHHRRPLVTCVRSSPPITTVHSHSFPVRITKSTSPVHHRRTPPLIGAKTTIICMANPRRVQRVAKQIQRELADMLVTDKVIQYAILPEAALGADMYLSSVTTISDVEISSDLQVVKAYVSVFGDARGREVAMAGLKSKARYVRSQLGKRMKLRMTPEIRFIEDESLERGSRVIAILDRIKAEKDNTIIGEDEPSDTIETDEDNTIIDEDEPSDSLQDDVDWEDDDPDEDIIYVQ